MSVPTVTTGDLITAAMWNLIDTAIEDSRVVLQDVSAVSTTVESTTLDSLQDSLLSVTITPKRDNSKLRIRVDGQCQVHWVAGASQTNRRMNVAILNVTDSVVLCDQERGRDLIGASASQALIAAPIALMAEWTVDSLDPRTFRFQYRTQVVTAVQASLRADRTGGLRMTIQEIAQ